MTDEPGLLAAIFADPEDDTPRLVYADWLEEHGDEAGRARAEFIRAQCEAARLPPGDKRAAEIEARCYRLRNKFDDAWVGPLFAASEQTFSFLYRRGFVYRVTANDHHIARRFPAVAALCPLTELQIDGAYNRVTAADLRALASRPELSRLRALDLNHVRPAAFAPLLPSPHLTSLRDLRVWCHDINGAARAVAASGLAARLRLLELWGREDRRLLIEVLLEQSWPLLEELRLETCELLGEDMFSLAARLRAPRLRMRHIGRNPIDHATLYAALRAPLLAGQSPALSAVSFTGLAPAPPEGWVDHPPGPNKLNLSGFDNGPDLLAALVMLPPAPLDALVLAGNELTAAEARTLASWPGLAGVKEMSLIANPLGDEGAAAIAASPHLDAVQTLLVRDTAMGKAGKQALKKRFGRRVRVT